MADWIPDRATTWKLDHPVWYAVSETHRDFALDYGGVRFYHPDYCPFGDFLAPDHIRSGLKTYGQLAGSFYLFAEPGAIGDHFHLLSSLLCCQMVLHEPVEVAIEEEIIPLQGERTAELSALVNLVQPGYFRRRTHELGRYYGILKHGKLVAASGERMQLDELTEVSAVVTHPEHTRRGYASQLITHTVRQILLDGKLPFLHVAADNTGAIRLYEKLGFRVRSHIVLWKLEYRQPK